MTIRRLLLIRHAKAVSSGEPDVERELAEQGTADAPAIGRWLAEQGLIPDRVVVSPAIRAGQTWALAAGPAGATVAPVVDERVYRNTVDDLLRVVRDTPADVRTLALVGHNPSIEDLAIGLDDGDGDAAARTELTRNYPTSGVAVFAIGSDWSALASGAGTVIGFAAPRG